MLYLEVMIYEEMVDLLYTLSEQMHSWKKNALLKFRISAAGCPDVNSRMVARQVQQKGTGLF